MSYVPIEEREARVAAFNATFPQARDEAKDAGMRLSNPSRESDHYQLRHLERGCILNLYANKRGGAPRAYHDPNRKGPFIQLPLEWTLIDAVRAAAAAWNKSAPIESH